MIHLAWVAIVAGPVPFTGPTRRHAQLGGDLSPRRTSASHPVYRLNVDTSPGTAGTHRHPVYKQPGPHGRRVATDLSRDVA